jgi:uncharacterized protein YacL
VCGVVGAFFVAQNFPTAFQGIRELLYSLGLTSDQYNATPLPQLSNPIILAAMGLLGFVIGAVVCNLMLRVYDRALTRWDTMDSGDKFTIFLSVVLGVLMSMPFMALLGKLNVSLSLFITFGVMLGITRLTMYALQSIGDILPWLKNKSRTKKKPIKILDTNVIIDGRIYDVIRTRFLDGNLYIPGFVLEELQHIADSQDPLRRQRGRRGLEVLRLLQSEFSLEVGTMDKLIPDMHDEVDNRLVHLAKVLGADIVTNDFNLNRVAALQHVNVLNINELALALKPTVLPRESLEVTIIREGNHSGQGVGYLEDGTMVVVENARKHLNDTISVMVNQVIQTERGRMIFAEYPEETEPEVVDSRRRRALK